MNWNEYALELATVAAKKSKDPWKQVGACLLRHDNTVAGIGYNGFPAGMREDWVDRDKRRLYIVHAEQNALRYVKPDECALIAVTLLPCNDCLRSIASYGIKTVVYRDIYDRDITSTPDIAPDRHDTVLDQIRKDYPHLRFTSGKFVCYSPTPVHVEV